jgi:hypothetical protein
MPSNKPKFLIIGSGWYGCHAASFLIEKGFNVSIVDKSNDIFVGSSLKNQNRLHLGFHYPRSEETRKESETGCVKFLKKYPKFVCDIKNNIYCISKESILDYGTYCKIMKDKSKYFSNIEDLKNIKGSFGLNHELIDGAMNTQEKLINPKKVKKHFTQLLSKKMIIIDSTYHLEKLKKEYDYVLDCTFGQMENFGNFKYELSICLVYSSKIKNFAITIMDGPFFSLFPMDIKQNLMTLTHVSHTPVCVSSDIKHINKVKNNFQQKSLSKIIRNMENEVLPYIPHFDKICEYKDFYLSVKTKSNQKNDNRSLFWRKDNKTINFAGGKITGIFAMEEIIKSQIIDKL